MTWWPLIPIVAITAYWTLGMLVSLPDRLRSKQYRGWVLSMLAVHLAALWLTAWGLHGNALQIRILEAQIQLLRAANGLQPDPEYPR